MTDLIGSLEFGCHQVITKIPDDFEEGKFRGLELLSVQITRPNLDVVIKALKNCTGN